MALELPAAIFVNRGARTAGTARVERAVELVRRALHADVHEIATRDAAELDAWLSKRMAGYATAVIAGGDGSLGIGLNVAVRHGGVTVGYVPAGFGNAAAHLLHLPRDPEGIAAVLAAAEARPIDLVAAGERLALFAGAGWDAGVAGRYAASRTSGHLGWAGAIARSAPDLWRRPRVAINADGWTLHRGPMTMLVVSTTPFYGRGLLVNPGARLHAGRVSARVYVGPAPRLALEAVRWAAGTSPRAERVDAQAIELRSLDGRAIPIQADGDLIGESTSWRFEVLPAAVRVIGRWS